MTDAERDYRRRMIDRSNALEAELMEAFEKIGHLPDPVVDQRWKAIAKTHFEEGFMALNRAIAKGGRL